MERDARGDELSDLRPRVAQAAIERWAEQADLASRTCPGDRPLEHLQRCGRIAGQHHGLGDERLDLADLEPALDRDEAGACFLEQGPRLVRPARPCRDPAEERGRERQPAPVSRRPIYAARVLQEVLGILVVAALEEDLGTVRARERGFDHVAGPQPGVSGALEQCECVVPASAVVRELAEVVGDRSLAPEVAELLVERERLDRVGGEVEPTQTDVRPIEKELRMGERVEIARNERARSPSRTT